MSTKSVDRRTLAGIIMDDSNEHFGYTTPKNGLLEFNIWKEELGEDYSTDQVLAMMQAAELQRIGSGIQMILSALLEDMYQKGTVNKD